MQHRLLLSALFQVLGLDPSWVLRIANAITRQGIIFCLVTYWKKSYGNVDILNCPNIDRFILALGLENQVECRWPHHYLDIYCIVLVEWSTLLGTARYFGAYTVYTLIRLDYSSPFYTHFRYITHVSISIQANYGFGTPTRSSSDDPYQPRSRLTGIFDKLIISQGQQGSRAVRRPEDRFIVLLYRNNYPKMAYGKHAVMRKGQYRSANEHLALKSGLRKIGPDEVGQLEL